MRHSESLCPWAYTFGSQSFNAALSSIASASRRLSFAFSGSNSVERCASAWHQIRLPIVEGHLGDTIFPAYVRHPGASLGFLRYAGNLLFGKSLFHVQPPVGQTLGWGETRSGRCDCIITTEGGGFMVGRLSKSMSSGTTQRYLYPDDFPGRCNRRLDNCPHDNSSRQFATTGSSRQICITVCPK